MKVDKKVLQAKAVAHRHSEEFFKFLKICNYITKKLHDSIDKVTAKPTCTPKQLENAKYWLHQSQLLMLLQVDLKEACDFDADNMKRINGILMETLPKIERDLKVYFERE